MRTFGAVDAPLEETVVAREGFIVSGFAYDERAGAFADVTVTHAGMPIGSTRLRHRRPDVPVALSSVRDLTCGFRITATLPSGPAGRVVLDICATFPDGAVWLASRTVVAGAADYGKGAYGSLLWADQKIVYRRQDIYTVGPPSEAASAECVALLTSHLAPGERVLDIGCGVGAYATPLSATGVAWEGCEVNPEFVDRIRARGLPVTAVEGNALPFESDAFPSAICIEVLEHIADYGAFLAEVSRVAKRVFFSVPNAEAIPVLADRLVVPWHLLEADHKNFFTRAGLHTTLEQYFSYVEIVPYGVMPLQSSNGAPVHYHLFAVADRC